MTDRDREIGRMLGVIERNQEVLAEHTRVLTQHTEELSSLKQSAKDRKEVCLEHRQQLLGLRKDVRGNGSGDGGLQTRVSTLEVLSGMRSKGFWLLTSAAVGCVSSALVVLLNAILRKGV